MGAVAFDTLKFAKRLKEAGFTEQQAEALAEAEAELFEAHLATKQDIAEVRREIVEVQRRIEEVRAELKHDLKDLEYRMLIKLGSLMVLAVGVVATLVKLL